MSNHTIPGGKDQGTPIEDASDSTLNYWINRITENLEKEPDSRFAARDRQLLAAMKTERATRSGDAGPSDTAGATGGRATSEPRQQPQPQSQAVTKVKASSLMGSFVDSEKATAALEQMAQNYHLVTPATACGNLPEGCEVQVSMVQISPDDPHLYPLSGGKLGLDHTHLQAILGAAGGSMEFSRRLDSGSHPHYCRMEVGIVYRLFDATPVRRSGTAEMDVREPNGPRYVEIMEKAKDGDRDPHKQLLELRKFLLPQTETRALNRAIAAMGVRRSYTKAELKKPFAVARLFFSGRSEDPEARKQFRAAIAQSFLMGQAALYGGSPQHVAPPAPQLQFHEPPPQGRGYDADTTGEDY